MKKFIKENWFKLVIVVILALVTLSILYYLLINPITKSRFLSNCLQEAEDVYDAREKERMDGLNEVYRERGVKEAKIKELGLKKDQLGASLEDEIRNPEMKNKFKEIELEILKKYKCDNPVTRLTKAFCETYNSEREVVKSYKNQNEEYKEINSNLDKLTTEVRELNERDRELNSEEWTEEKEKALKEAKDFCIKLYGK